MTSPLIIASVQMTSCANFQSNIDAALSLIDDATLAGANIIVLQSILHLWVLKKPINLSIWKQRIQALCKRQ